MTGVPDDTALVVEVEETITSALAGHEGCRYASPPLPRAEAFALVRVLTGRDEQADGRRCWHCPIAGGQRTVTLRPPARIAQPGGGQQPGEAEEND
jgi:hypothetical protein